MEDKKPDIWEQKFPPVGKEEGHIPYSTFKKALSAAMIFGGAACVGIAGVILLAEPETQLHKGTVTDGPEKVVLSIEWKKGVLPPTVVAYDKNEEVITIDILGDSISPDWTGQGHKSGTLEGTLISLLQNYYQNSTIKDNDFNELFSRYDRHQISAYLTDFDKFVKSSEQQQTFPYDTNTDPSQYPQATP